MACGEKASRVIASLREIRPDSFKKTQDHDLARVLAPLVRAKCPTPTKQPAPLTASR